MQLGCIFKPKFEVEIKIPQNCHSLVLSPRTEKIFWSSQLRRGGQIVFPLKPGGGGASAANWADKIKVLAGWTPLRGRVPCSLRNSLPVPHLKRDEEKSAPKKIPFEYQGGLIGNDCWWEKNSVGKNMDWILKMRGKTLKKSREPIVQKKSIIHIKIPRFPKYTFKIGDIWWNCEIGKNETHSWFWLVNSLLIGVLEQKQNPRISMTTEHRRKLLGVHWRRLESSQIFQEKFWMDP